MRTLITQFGVNLIANHQKILFHTNLGQGIQILPGKNRPGWIRGKIQQQNLCAGSRCGHGLRIQAKTVLRPGSDRPAFRVRQTDGRRIGNVAGFVIKHRLAWIQYRPQGQIDRFAHSHGDKNLSLRTVPLPTKLLHIGRDFISELQAPQIGRIPGASVLQGIDGRLPNRPRSGNVGFPDSQGDHIPPLLHQFKKITDSGTGNPFYMLCQKIYGLFHGETDKRSVFSSCRKRTPASL